jgi:hypothetical protein
MFSFLSKDKPPGIPKRALEAINGAVYQFLQVRGVKNFKVYTIDYEQHPVVLIQAVAQKKLRFSNILEIQIKHHLREKLGCRVAAIFWRFKIDNSEQPGPEQADYDYDESSESSQDRQTIEPGSDAQAPESNAASEPDQELLSNQNNTGRYDVRLLVHGGMEVEEISMGEFTEFLKGSTHWDAPEKDGQP